MGSRSHWAAQLPEQHAHRAGDQGRPGPPLVGHQTPASRSRRPAPFRTMYDEPSPDGRSVISLDEGRVFDIGAWPPRPSGVRFAHPGWVHRCDHSADPEPFATSNTARTGGSSRPADAGRGATGDSGDSPVPTAGLRSRRPNSHGNRTQGPLRPAPSSTRAGPGRSSGRIRRIERHPSASGSWTWRPGPFARRAFATPHWSGMSCSLPTAATSPRPATTAPPGSGRRPPAGRPAPRCGTRTTSRPSRSVPMGTPSPPATTGRPDSSSSGTGGRARRSARRSAMTTSS